MRNNEFTELTDAHVAQTQVPTGDYLSFTKNELEFTEKKKDLGNGIKVDVDLERFNHIRLRAVPQGGCASEEIERCERKKQGQPRGNWAGASPSLQFSSWQFRSLQSCRALTQLAEKGLLAVKNSELKQGKR